MIKIKIPNNNISERKYILDVIFNEFLDLKYEVIIDYDTDNWEIILENQNKLIIKDKFFNKYLKDLDYLKIENIPEKIKFGKNNFIVEEDVPIIYGVDKFDIVDKEILCGIDIFASSFFMLTRWEEYVNKERDNHNRFPYKESLAFKNNFLDRPIVNEYIEMLKNMLCLLDSSLQFRRYNYKLIITHDIDHIYAWDSFKKFVLNLVRDLFKRPSIKDFFNSIVYYIQVKLKIKNDPYDTYDYIMMLSESVGVKSYFFFMAEGLTSYDNHYTSGSDKAKKIVSNILERGHYIGIHPTYNTYNDPKQFNKEKLELEKNFKTKIVFGRQHYLRFEVPITWQIWEDNDMRWDSTMNYADRDGFRCGICYEYSLFNILTREKLKLKEKPLIVMDANSIDRLSPVEMEYYIQELIAKVKKYKGEFVLLWHNSSYNTAKWKKYKSVYENIITYHKEGSRI